MALVFQLFPTLRLTLPLRSKLLIETTTGQVALLLRTSMRSITHPTTRPKTMKG